MLPSRLTTAARRFARDERGASMVEYGLLLGVVSLVCVTLISLTSPSLNTILNRLALSLSAL